MMRPTTAVARSDARAFPRLLIAVLGVCALLLGACSAGRLGMIDNAEPPKLEQRRTVSEQTPQQQREHLRILAAYGGNYDNARLQAMLEKTVDKLVAASERPDLKYDVTILNS